MVLEVLNEDRFKRLNPETGELESYMANSVIGQVGNGTSDPQEGPSLGNTPHKARIVVNFVKFQERQGQSTRDMLRAVRERLSGYRSGNRGDQKLRRAAQGPPINIEIRGEDYDDVLAAATSMRQYLRGLDFAGVEELKIDVDKRKPELPITIDREKARRYGLSTQNIGFTIRTALFGREVSSYKDGEDDYPINVRFEESARNNVDALMNQKVIFRSASDGQIKEVPISAVATAERSTTFSSVKRKTSTASSPSARTCWRAPTPMRLLRKWKRPWTDLRSPTACGLRLPVSRKSRPRSWRFCRALCCLRCF